MEFDPDFLAVLDHLAEAGAVTIGLDQRITTGLRLDDLNLLAGLADDVVSLAITASEAIAAWQASDGRTDRAETTELRVQAIATLAPLRDAVELFRRIDAQLS